ncbi:MAG: hypothetical protein MUF48_08140 [Pirellulaceae bacterium]|jgi:hypothetical protein|nr:hypothetical protein [Pirellulaceae bacterium]
MDAGFSYRFLSSANARRLEKIRSNPYKFARFRDALTMARPDHDNSLMMQTTASVPQAGSPDFRTPHWGWMLSVWIALTIILRGVFWTTGIPDYRLIQAIEQGAARVELHAAGEENVDVIRKSIELQRDSLAFWTVLAALGDFVLDPLWLGLRALSVAVALSAVAAMTGRPARFPAMMSEAVAWQSVWVFGLACRVAWMFILQRGDIDTSLALLMPERIYGAREWVLFQQVDLFALVGWMGLAWGGVRRGQANLLVSLLVCGFLAVLESQVYASCSLLLNLGMRVALFPE